MRTKMTPVIEKETSVSSCVLSNNSFVTLSDDLNVETEEGRTVIRENEDQNLVFNQTYTIQLTLYPSTGFD